MQPGAEWKKRFAPNGADRFERYAREFVEMRKRKTHGVDGANARRAVSLAQDPRFVLGAKHAATRQPDKFRRCAFWRPNDGRPMAILSFDAAIQRTARIAMAIPSNMTFRALCKASRVTRAHRRRNKSVILRRSILLMSRRLSLSESWLALARRRCFRFGRGNQTLADSRLAGKLASAANSFPFFTHSPFRRLFIGGPKLHLAEDSLALHFLLQELQCLVNVIVADGNEQNISNLAVANRRLDRGGRHASPRSPNSAP